MHHPPDPSWCARLRAASPPTLTPAPSPEPLTEASGPESAPAAAAPQPEPAPRPTPFVYRETPTHHVCEMCGTGMYDHNCKIVCPNCGYKRDCSDP